VELGTEKEWDSASVVLVQSKVDDDLVIVPGYRSELQNEVRISWFRSAELEPDSLAAWRP
jgi:hypothetical protein